VPDRYCRYRSYRPLPQLLFMFHSMPIIMVRDLVRTVSDVHSQLRNLLAARR
jgi:hypothetical protein